METNEDGEDDSCKSPNLPKPVLRIHACEQPNSVTCAICNVTVDKKNAKRRNISLIQKKDTFKTNAILWEQYEHVYASTYHKVDWNAEKLYGCKSCKAMFSNSSLREAQKIKQVTDHPEENHTENTISMPTSEERNDKQSKRASSRRSVKYSTTVRKPVCIICNKERYDRKHNKIPVITISYRKEGERLHQAEKKLLEYAKIHDEHGTKFYEAAQRILLTNSTKSLFAADVGYHRLGCYMQFTTCSWKRKFIRKDEPVPTEDTLVDEFLDLVEVHVIIKGEVYTLAQLRKCYDDMRGSNSRSTDVKDILIKIFGDKIDFGKPVESSSTTSEFVYSSSIHFTPGAISSAVTGNGIETSLMLKNLARRISNQIKSRPKNPWPPTPQQIIQSEDDVNMNLYNFLALVASPYSTIDNTCTVRLSESKATKITKICEDIESLVPTCKPSLSQMLFSLNSHRRTGSSNVVNDIHDFGHGISYTDTLFIEDKWAEWSEKQTSFIPSNIEKGQIVTHVVDNIDWQNKSTHGDETHHTNSIVIQESTNPGRGASVALEPDYNFQRKEHKSFKGTLSNIPNIKFTRCEAKILKFDSEDFADNDRSEAERSSSKSLLWVLSRLNNDKMPADQDIPGWGGFQELCGMNSFPVNVGYLPPIRAPPTEMRVIYAAINRSLDIMDELGNKYIFMEVDQAIYHKVLDAMFKMEKGGLSIFEKVIPRMGGFHVVLCMIRTIFSRFKNAGIVELVSSAGLGGKGTIKKALNGGDTKQAIFLYKLLFEALMRYKIEHLKSEDPGCLPPPVVLKEVSKENVDMMIDQGYIKALPRLTGDMAQWIDSLLDMINMLLNMVHFQRSGNWKGFLEIVYEFLPYCFNHNRHNYARNLSYFYCHMRKLENENEEAFLYMLKGGFTGSLTGKAHTKIAMDQIMETTINRSSKEVGGLSGNTENEGASERWIRINHFMSALKEHQHRKIRKKKVQHHEDIGKMKKERDERNVRCVLVCVRSWVPELWTDSQAMVNVATGEVATENMKKEFRSSENRGEEARDEFFKRFTHVSNTIRSKKSYYDSITKQPSTIFLPEKKPMKELVIPTDECQSFAELLSQFDGKLLQLRSAMHGRVTSRPWMIVNENNKARGNAKSVFRNMLQQCSPAPSSNNVPAGINVSIVDAMRVVNMITIKKLKPRTFRRWSRDVFDYMKHLPGEALHVVFDNYAYEYHVPSKDRFNGAPRLLSSIDQELPHDNEWFDFLGNAGNKSQLINLLVSHLTGEYEMGKDIYVNNGDTCYFKAQLNQSTSTICDELFSKHREADQKVVSHAVFESERGNNVCVVADDSDIFILLLSVAHLFQTDVYFRQGKTTDKDGILYNQIQPLAEYFGEDVCSALPAFHVLTGSDYTSTFFGKTKYTCFKRMLARPETCHLLNSLNTSVANVDEVSEFVLRVIYNRPRKEKTLGEARYNMLFVKGKKKKYASTKAIPPDSISLSLKIQRDNYVTMGYVNCLNPYYVPPPATQYAWEDVNGVLTPIWAVGPPLPEFDDDLNDENSPAPHDVRDDNQNVCDINMNEFDEDTETNDSESDDEDDESDYPESDIENFESDSEI